MTQEFFKKHKDAFLSEAHLNIKNMSAALLNLEKNPDDKKLLHTLFQATHTLKGMAATMGYEQFAALCHVIESLLDFISKKKYTVSACADLLFECFDFLNASLKSLANAQEELMSQDLIQQVRSFLSDDKKNINRLQKKPKRFSYDSERVHAIEVKVERLDTLMNLSEELLVSRLKLDLLRESISHPELTAVVDTIDRLVTDIQFNIMQVRLVPISAIFNRFPRMVRDLSKEQNKEIDLLLKGEDIELDRSVIEVIGQSLVHLVRNAIDHGIETVSERKKKNKPHRGVIELNAKRTKDFVTIEIKDDGKGLDLPAIKNIAIQKNMVQEDVPNEEIRNLIFNDISTNKHITAVSGRGLGLSIVKQKIESVGGIIHVQSIMNKGTQFYIDLPLTLTVIKVLFVKVGQQIYGIPVNNIERLLILPRKDFKGLLNFEAIIYGGEDIPILYLADLFGEEVQPLDQQPIVVVFKEGEKLGLAVDKLLSTQEVVIKPLGSVIKENKYFSGSALVGSGEMILIIDISHLLLSKSKKDKRSEGYATQ